MFHLIIYIMNLTDFDFSRPKVRLNGEVLSKFALAKAMCSLPGCYWRFNCYVIYNDYYSYKEIRNALLSYISNS